MVLTCIIEVLVFSNGDLEIKDYDDIDFEKNCIALCYDGQHYDIVTNNEEILKSKFY